MMNNDVPICSNCRYCDTHLETNGYSPVCKHEDAIERPFSVVTGETGWLCNPCVKERSTGKCGKNGANFEEKQKRHWLIRFLFSE